MEEREEVMGVIKAEGPDQEESDEDPGTPDDDDEGNAASGVICSPHTPKPTPEFTALKNGLEGDDSGTNLASEVGSDSENTWQSIEGSYRCHVCGLIFDTLTSLQHHKPTHTDDKQFQCPVCLKYYKYKHNLRVHMASHDEHKAVKCAHCDQVFGSVGMLRKHESVHAHVRYHCKTCNKIFKSKLFFKYHQNLHANIHLHVCEVCGKRFPLKSLLKKHEVCHDNIPSFKCSQCSKCYKHLRALKRHQVQNHLMDAGIKYPCNICNKVWSSPSALRLHVQSHSKKLDFQCSICQEKFARERSLKHHMKLHSAVGNTYKCDVCNRRFPYLSFLQSHMQSHSKQHNFACCYCDQRYKHRQTLARHIKRFHYNAISTNNPSDETDTNLRHGMNTPSDKTKTNLRHLVLKRTYKKPPSIKIKAEKDCKKCEQLYPVTVDLDTCRLVHSQPREARVKVDRLPQLVIPGAQVLIEVPNEDRIETSVTADSKDTVQDKSTLSHKKLIQNIIQQIPPEILKQIPPEVIQKVDDSPHLKAQEIVQVLFETIPRSEMQNVIQGIHQHKLKQAQQSSGRFKIQNIFPQKPVKHEHTLVAKSVPNILQRNHNQMSQSIIHPTTQKPPPASKPVVFGPFRFPVVSLDLQTVKSGGTIFQGVPFTLVHIEKPNTVIAPAKVKSSRTKVKLSTPEKQGPGFQTVTAQSGYPAESAIEQIATALLSTDTGAVADGARTTLVSAPGVGGRVAKAPRKTPVRSSNKINISEPGEITNVLVQNTDVCNEQPWASVLCKTPVKSPDRMDIVVKKESNTHDPFTNTDVIDETTTGTQHWTSSGCDLLMHNILDKEYAAPLSEMRAREMEDTQQGCIPPTVTDTSSDSYATIRALLNRGVQHHPPNYAANETEPEQNRLLGVCIKQEKDGPEDAYTSFDVWLKDEDYEDNPNVQVIAPIHDDDDDDDDDDDFLDISNHSSTSPGLVNIKYDNSESLGLEIPMDRDFSNDLSLPCIAEGSSSRHSNEDNTSESSGPKLDVVSNILDISLRNSNSSEQYESCLICKNVIRSRESMSPCFGSASDLDGGEQEGPDPNMDPWENGEQVECLHGDTVIKTEGSTVTVSLNSGI